MSKNLKIKVLLSVLALGLSWGFQSAEAAIPSNVKLLDDVEAGEKYVDNFKSFIVTAFFAEAKGATATDYSISMNGGEVDNIYAAVTQSGAAKENKLDIYNGKINGFAAAATSAKAALQYNEANFRGGDVENVAGANGNGTLTANRLSISGGSAGLAAGAFGAGKLNENQAVIYGGNALLFGGAIASGKGTATKNMANYSNSAGMSLTAAGAIVENGTAKANILDINQGTAMIAAGAVAQGKGSVLDNKVVVYGGSPMMLYGGVTAGGNATNNIVSVGETGAATVQMSVIGGATVSLTETKSKGAANGNVVTIGNNANVAGASITGGQAELGTANNNLVAIVYTSGTHDVGEVIGGLSESGKVTSNHVEASGIISDAVYGAKTGGKGTATSNTVGLFGSAISNFVFGAETELGAANKNTVTINNSVGNSDVVCAALSQSGNTSYNEVFINNGDFHLVYGGSTDNSGVANKNKVEMKDATASNKIVGGWATAGTANYNTVTLTNVKSDSSGVLKVYAGLGSTGSLVGNRANLENCDLRSAVAAYSEKASKATGNKVELLGTKISKTAAGAVTDGVAKNNSINVTSSSCYDVYGGYSSGEGLVSGNKVFMTDSTSDSQIVGGWADDGGNATSNRVEISDSTVEEIYGGVSGKTASSNKVIIDENTEADSVCGGMGGELALKNSVQWNGKTANIVIGGQSGKVAKQNTVNIYGGTFADGPSYGIFGGKVSYGYDTAATKNIVNLYACKAGSVYGGYAVEGDVVANTVNVKTNEVSTGVNASSETVYGGYAKSGSANNNIVNIVAGTLTNITGGYSEADGNANGNKVTISNATIKGVATIYGGYADSGNDSGNTNNNIISLKNVNASGTMILGGASAGQANGNKVTIYNSNVELVYGGGAAGGGAVNNSVTISGTSQVGNVSGAESLSGSDKLSNNSVTIKDNAVIQNAVKGAGTNGDNNKVTLSGNARVQGNVTVCDGAGNNNKVTMSGNSHVEGDVVVCKLGGTGNSITMSGKAIVDGKISGYQIQKGVPKEKLTITGGGSLVLDGWSGSVGAVEGFESISFKNITAKSGTSMMVLAKGEDSDLSGTTITVGNTMLASGVKGVSVMSSEDGKLDVSGAKLEDGSAQTVGTTGVMKLAANDNAITANYVAGGVNPQTKALAESRTAAAAFVNQGTEIVEHGIGQVAANGNGTKTFAALFGNASRYNTGSHVKVNGWSGIVGIGNTVNNGKLTYGAFFENGTGNYRTFASAMGMPIRGYGEATYNGGGLLVKNKSSKGVYVEGAVRAGRLQNKLNDAVLGGNGLKGYDVSTSYYGAHIGVGKEIKLSEHTALDLYAKYLYTHHGSKSYRIDGDEFRFDSLNSQRTRLGFRINSKLNDKAKLYYGLVWDYELDGKADNKVQGYSLHTPSLKGSTVFLDLGAEYKLNDKWSLDINAKGYAGERRGVTGSAQVSYSF